MRIDDPKTPALLRTGPTAQPAPTPAPTATPAPAADRFQAAPAAAPLADPASNPRDVAARRARDFLEGAETSRTRTDNGGVVVSDPNHVNDAADTDPASARHRDAQALVTENRPLEEQTLAALPPDQRAQYEQVRGTAEAAGDPVAELALQTMLLEGKLPGEAALVGEENLLSSLATLADPNTPLAEGLDRGELLTEVIQEVAVPSAIAQRSKNTCVPTAVTVQLAADKPAEYVRIVTGLASPEGQVELASGKTLERDEGTLEDDGSGRSNSQRLVEPALMEFSNGLLNYDNAADKHYLGPIPTVPGAAAVMADGMLEAIYDRKFEHRAFLTFGAMDEIDRQLENGGTVLVTLKWDEGTLSWHKVLVVGTETVDGQEQIRYLNPWGQEELMPRDEFEDRLRELNWDPSVGRPDPAPAPPAEATPEPAPAPTPAPAPSATPTPAEQLEAQRRLVRVTG